MVYLKFFAKETWNLNISFKKTPIAQTSFFNQNLKECTRKIPSKIAIPLLMLETWYLANDDNSL